jgi:hypothetical protein
VVFWTNSDRLWIEANYVNGIREGVENRWYRESGDKMSLHTFSKGVLDGAVIKYRNNSNGGVLAQGVFKSGKPWDGTFLEGWDGELDPSFDVIDRSVPYWFREYKAGMMTRRFKSP